MNIRGRRHLEPPPAEWLRGSRWSKRAEEAEEPYEPLPEAIEFPVEALPPACARLVEEATYSLGCAPELVALPMLAALSSAIGAARVVEIKRGWREGATLFLAAVASPGAMKTPAASIAKRPVIERQREQERRYQEEKERWKKEMREWEVDKKLALKDGEVAPERPEPPAMERSIMGDTTLEALVGVLKDNPRGLLVHKDELVGWVRSMDQYKGGRGSDRQNWLSLWSNEEVIVDRKSREGEPIFLARPFISLFGGIQPAMLSELGAAMEDGLMDRFLFAYPATRVIRYSEREISREAEEAYAALYRRLADGLLTAFDEYDNPNPRPVKMTFAAKRRFAAAVDALSAETVEPGFPPRLEGVWSKMRGYLARLSLVLALCRCAADGLSSSEEAIEEEDVQDALALIGYFKCHARRVYAEVSAATPEDLLAGELKDFLEEEGGEWAGSASALYDKLYEREAAGLPENPDWLTRMVLRIAERSPGLEAERKRKKVEDRVQRLLVLALQNGVDGVHGVHPDDESAPGSYAESGEEVNTMNTMNTKSEEKASRNGHSRGVKWLE